MLMKRLKMEKAKKLKLQLTTLTRVNFSEQMGNQSFPHIMLMTKL